MGETLELWLTEQGLGWCGIKVEIPGKILIAVSSKC